MQRTVEVKIALSNTQDLKINEQSLQKCNIIAGKLDKASCTKTPKNNLSAYHIRARVEIKFKSDIN